MTEAITLRVAAYTGGPAVPSARFRIRQYIRPLLRYGIRLDEHCSRVGQYPPALRGARPMWLVAGLLERAVKAPSSYRYDLVVFQRELLSTLVTVERFFSAPRILDVDDAIWLHSRGAFTERLAQLCDAIICGNSFIAEYFDGLGCRTFVVPTAIDMDRFVPMPRRDGSSPIIGWSGTSGNLVQLQRIEPVLHEVLRRHRDVRLRVICDRRPTFNLLPVDRVEYIEWSEEKEVGAIRELAIGLMPLAEDEWSRGKCAFKMLSYMACGIPVVVTPVGVNAELLGQGELGFGARSKAEWVDALSQLLTDRELAMRMGAVGRAVVARGFSSDVVATKLAGVLRAVSEGRK